ncbi:MAG: MBL fold metallo-hydrolase [Kiritimatiellae bacterium]|nr:MBL fold metallo-hydrolase [Kiritimatiellia bacterium]
MNRREFLALATCAATFTKGYTANADKSLIADIKEAVELFESTTMFDYEKRLGALEKAQRVIYAMKTGVPFLKHQSAGLSLSEEDVAKTHALHPALWWYDRAFEKVLKEFQETKVTTNKPAIWYIYNMGIVVKTSTVSFSIDLSHRQGVKFAPLLDFALTTHSHGDHWSREFTNAMLKNGKHVISNFLLEPGYYFKGDRKTYTFGDVKVHVSEADHNKRLLKAIMCFEVEFGGEKPFVIFHSGDTHRASCLRPINPNPDIFMGHCAIGLNFNVAYTTSMPAKLMLPLHHQELGHLGGKYRCVGFHEEPKKYMKSLPEIGANTALPVWGDRIC